MSRDCHVFRDLYSVYGFEECEEETRDWLKVHIENCTECSQWIEKQSYDDVGNDYESINMSREDYEVLLTTKIIFGIGIGIIILFSIWLSIWFLI